MIRPCLFHLCCALTVAAVPVWVWAQTKPSPNQSALLLAAPPSAQTPGNVVIRNAKSGGTASYNDAQGVVVLTKDVTVTQTGEEFFLSAQKVRYSRPQNQANATGNLKVQTRNSTLRGAQLFGDFNAKMLTLTGQVIISAHGKNDGMTGEFGQQLGRKPVKIACNRVDWNYQTRQAILSGHLRMVQDDNIGTCNKIIYDEPQNAVHLIGNVRFGNNKKQQFIGNDVVIYVDSGVVQSQDQIQVVSPVEAAPTKPTKPAPRIEFPKQSTVSTEDIAPAPPPISSLVPTPTPKPTSAPVPKPTSAPSPEPTVTD